MGEIKRIPESFTRKGVKYDRVEVGETYMIYRGELFGAYWYELFQRRVSNPGQMRVVDKDSGETSVIEMSASETFPSDESFGKWAWTLPDLESARKRSATIDLHKSMVEAEKR